MGRRGSVMVEFALVGTLFFALFMSALLLGFWTFAYSSLEGAVRDVGRTCAAHMGTKSTTDTLCQSSAGIRTLLEPRLADFFIMSNVKVSSYQFDSIEAAKNHAPTQALNASAGTEVFAAGTGEFVTYEVFYDYPIANQIPYIGEVADIRAYTVLMREP